MDSTVSTALDWLKTARDKVRALASGEEDTLIGGLGTGAEIVVGIPLVA